MKSSTFSIIMSLLLFGSPMLFAQVKKADLNKNEGLKVIVPKQKVLPARKLKYYKNQEPVKVNQAIEQNDPALIKLTKNGELIFQLIEFQSKIASVSNRNIVLLENGYSLAYNNRILKLPPFQKGKFISVRYNPVFIQGAGMSSMKLTDDKNLLLHTIQQGGNTPIEVKEETYSVSQSRKMEKQISNESEVVSKVETFLQIKNEKIPLVENKAVQFQSANGEKLEITLQQSTHTKNLTGDSDEAPPYFLEYFVRRVE